MCWLWLPRGEFPPSPPLSIPLEIYLSFLKSLFVSVVILLKKIHILTLETSSPGIPPVCKVLSRASLIAAEKARKAAQKNKDPTKTVKGLEMNWAIEKGDLAHRLQRLRQWLEKGWRVEVVLAKKRKGRVASEEEGREVVRRVREVLEDVGGRENKPAEGKLGAVMTIYCEGKKKEGGEGGGS